MWFEIRKPRKEDITKINKLFEQTIQDSFKKEGIIDPLNLEANKEIEALKQSLNEYFNSKNLKDNFLIACDKDHILGTIAYGKANRLIEENLKIDYSGVPEIKSVYILPNYQNKGIGTFLFTKTLVHLKEDKINYFCLDCGYKSAQQYWSNRLGQPLCVLKNYWSKGNHHMIWHGHVDKILDALQRDNNTYL